MTTRAALPFDVLARERDRIIELAQNASTAQVVFAVVSDALEDLVPSDAAGWYGIDPSSLLPTWPARIENLVPGQCTPYWEREFLKDDVLAIHDLATGAQTTGTLRNELDGLMNRSVRYREFLEPMGFQDELRSAFRSGNSMWGLLVLLRGNDLPAFSADESRFIDSLSQPLAEALRMKVLFGRSELETERRPGILTYGLDGQMVSANDAALYWLDQVSNSTIIETAPVAMQTMVSHARAVEAGRAHSVPAMLLPSRSGRWLTAHASALRGPDGKPREFAVTIEPAARHDLAPMLAEAYGLSRRELEVARRLARGEATAAIAETLFLSEHTVRDHVKAILSKTGVSSRAALVAHLFLEGIHAAEADDVVLV